MNSPEANEDPGCAGELSPQVETKVEPAAVFQELERILSSPTFQTSERLRNFLRYTVEQSIKGRGDLIKEYSVGTEVFGRAPSFDPRIDTIVRTEARKLRARLTIYYETLGKEDPVRIEFRKGSYAPHFRTPAAEPPPAPAVLQPEVTLAEASIEPAAFPAHVEESTPEAKPFSLGRSGVLWGSGAILVLLVIVTIAVTRLVRSGVPAAPNAAQSPSIAVLPFLNLSDDKKDDDFLSDGLTDELIDSLGRVPGLHVVARTSAFQYKGKTPDIRKVGRDLNVRDVLEGTVRKSGNRLRITVELDDTLNGYRVWSQSYDRELKDELAIQREISQAITTSLGVRLARNGSGQFESAEDFPVSTEAHEAYLKGLHFWNKLNADGIQTAIGYFEQALTLEPRYALAYEGLAHCYTQIPVFTGTPPPAVIPKIRAAASKALELDPSIGEAHLDLAVAFDYDYDWDSAGEEFRRGLELSPADALAHRLYSVHLVNIGRPDEALKEDKMAQELDPVSPFMAQGIGRSLYNMGRFDEAIEQYKKALALDSNFRLAHWGLGSAYISAKMYPQGLAELQEAYRLAPDSSAAGRLGYAYAVMGQKSEAMKILTDLKHARLSRDHDIARIYLGLGDVDQAFWWLKKSVDEKEAYLYLKTDPLYDSIRSDPRFAALLKAMRLS